MTDDTPTSKLCKYVKEELNATIDIEALNEIVPCVLNVHDLAPQIKLPVLWFYVYPEVDPTVVLAHEAGHIMDYYQRPWAYSKGWGYNTFMSTMDIEMSAWDQALRLLKMVGYTDMDSFERTRCQFLSNYYDSYSPWGSTHRLERQVSE